MNTLNIDTFNEILLKAAKDEESKVKILESELAIVADMFYSEVAVLLDELVDNGYKSEQFQKILNIKNNSERLLEMLEELQSKTESDEQEEIDDYRDRLDELEREEYYESKYGKEQE